MESIGVDTGGTFTDCVLIRGKETIVLKVPSTPENPSRAILEGVDLLPDEAATPVVHGTTVALNALLTGRTARTALITNSGFRDLIEIGRQDRPRLYELNPRKPKALVPRELRFEIDQRSAPSDNGTLTELRTPKLDALQQLKRELADADIEALAVCLLHSYADPTIEARIAEELASLNLPITCSAHVLAEYREYERFSTAIANAALVPVMQTYLTELESGLAERRLDLMQSSGGTLSAAQAAVEPVRVLFSGPAGGVIGASRAAKQAGFDEIVALDMGGTSTDVAFHSTSQRSALGETRIAGHPIGVPALDIHTIGTGGGSLVSVDDAGILHVGPESAGADPGPVGYGKGEQLTVTDAHIQLGHIAASTFAGGRVALDPERVADKFEVLSRQLGVTVPEAARSVLEVARAAMRRAIGVMTMQRGQDPGRLPLVAFGGAGGLHAAALAESLDMRGALIPAYPGVLSAWGMAHADALCDRSRSVLRPLVTMDDGERRALREELEREAQEQLEQDGSAAATIRVETVLELRYRGQDATLAIREEGDSAEALCAQFHERHRERYGWSLEETEVELVHIRARARTARELPPSEEYETRPLDSDSVLGTRTAWFDEALEVPRIARESLRPGQEFEGPALLEESTGTGLVPPGWTARVLGGGHLWLTKNVSR